MKDMILGAILFIVIVWTMSAAMNVGTVLR